MHLFLLRHGESENNTLPRERHVPDPELTALGRRQAERLADAVARLEPTVLLSSPLVRSLETARPAVARCRVPWLVWADAAEAHRAHPGDGWPVSRLRARFPDAVFDAGMPWPGHPGDETWAQAAARAARLLDRLRAAFGDGGRVALFGHGTFNGYIIRRCLGAPQDGTVAIDQGNACVNHLAWPPGGGVRVVSCNDCRHLA